MLGQLDQMALYNAANFNLSPTGYGPFNVQNSTVANATVANFLCPSDPYAGPSGNNSYYACVGTSTGRSVSSTAGKQSSGLFAWYFSYGLRDCLDEPATNTVAFAEGRLGTALNGPEPLSVLYPGNTIIIEQSPVTGSAGNVDAFADQANIFKDLQTCAKNWSVAAGTICSRRGYLWVDGVIGHSMFNTIQTPNDTQYPGNGCRLDTGCVSHCGPDDSMFVPASSVHPGARKRLGMGTAASASSRIRSIASPGGNSAPRRAARSSVATPTDRPWPQWSAQSGPRNLPGTARINDPPIRALTCPDRLSRTPGFPISSPQIFFHRRLSQDPSARRRDERDIVVSGIVIDATYH